MASTNMGGNLGGGRSRGRRGRPSSAPMADINVTPLVDVMLVLLIIFMVTAPLLTSGVPVALPDSNARPLDQSQREPVQITLDADGQLFVGDDAVAIVALPERLAALAGAGGETTPSIMLRADRALDYGRVMRVMGEINRAGFTRVALVTTSSDGGQ